MERSLISLFEARVNSRAGATALRSFDGKVLDDLSWRACWEATERLAAALIVAGVGVGDRVVLLSRTRLEWALFDIAIMMAGGVVVPVYPSTTEENALAIFDNCAPVAIIAQDLEQVAKFEQRLDGDLQVVVYLDELRGYSADDFGAGVIRYEELVVRGRRAIADDSFVVAERRRALERSTLASIIYTSGTTGEQKGVELTHGNLLAEIEGLLALDFIDDSDVSLLVLPMAHVFARVVFWVMIAAGAQTVFGSSLDRLRRDLEVAAPTIFAGVPHIFENIQRNLERQFEQVAPAGTLGAIGFEQLFERAKVVSEAKLSGRRLTFAQRAYERLLEPLLYQRVRQVFGGRLRFLVSGGAPLSEEVAKFYHACGVLVLEGYGLTETCAAIAFNSIHDFRFGSVGRPIDGADITIAEDSEILVRSPVCSSAYHKLPDATAELIDADGWMHTGDLGRFDADGFLYITGRKKNLIVTSGGKNIAPVQIEEKIERSGFIDHALIVGDRRHYLTALITLDVSGVQRELDEPSGDDGWAGDERVQRAVGAHIDEVNAELPGFGAVRKFTILPTEFSLETGELTPTLKLRRSHVELKYRDWIEAMYAR